MSCLECPSGRITPKVGASDESQCLSPAANFAFGFLTLLLAMVVSSVYIVNGGFHLIAFIRRERIITFIADEYKVLLLRIIEILGTAKESFNDANIEEIVKKTI